MINRGVYLIKFKRKKIKIKVKERKSKSRAELITHVVEYPTRGTNYKDEGNDNRKKMKKKYNYCFPKKSMATCFYFCGKCNLEVFVILVFFFQGQYNKFVFFLCVFVAYIYLFIYFWKKAVPQKCLIEMKIRIFDRNWIEISLW